MPTPLTYKMKCRNIHCNLESTRYSTKESFDAQVDGTDKQYSCPQCGYPRMMRIITRARIRDGFTPGFQENIQRYAGSQREYEKILREMGLVERGYDCDIVESKLDSSPCANEYFVRACLDEGIKLNDVEADAIISGEYFKDNVAN